VISYWVNQWIAAAAQKVRTVETAAEFFKRRAGDAAPENLLEILRSAPDAAPEPGDEREEE
jgi:hypothetical protein